MWKCPNCETINQGDTCAICGHAKVVQPDKCCPHCNSPVTEDAVFCKNCGKPLADNYIHSRSDQNDQTSGGGNNPYTPPTPIDDYHPTPKSNQNLIIAIVVAVATITICIVALFAILTSNNNSDYNDNAPTETEVEEEETETPEPTPTPTPTHSFVPTTPPRKTSEPSNIRITETVPDKFGAINYTRSKDYVSSTEAYQRMINDTYHYYCDYPSDFVHTRGDNMEIFTAPDQTAVMKVYSATNAAGQTRDSEMQSIINQLGGTVEYSATGNEWFAVSITSNHICYYVKGYVDDYIREFIFYFPEEYLTFYDSYIEHIEANFRRTD